MDKIAKVLQLIQHTASYNDKQYLLKKNEQLPGLKKVLFFIYNPYLRTGISKTKLAKALDMAEYNSAGATVQLEASYESIIEYLSKHNTGSAYDLGVAARFIRAVRDTMPDAEWLAHAIITQDLKLGVNVTTLNTVYGKNFIPKLGCMLGKLLSDIREEKRTWPYIVTEKLDGVRRLLVKENGVVKLYSRSGHEDVGLPDIMSEAQAFLPDNTVYDGELLAMGSFKDSIAQRQATNSIANSGGIRNNLTFNVFDMVPLDEFKNGCSKFPAQERKILLGATFMDDSIACLAPEKYSQFIAAFGLYRTLNYIKPVPILGIARNMSDVEALVAPIWKRGGEGVMLNSPQGKYEVKRTTHLLKVKRIEEYVLTVIDVEEGTGRLEDNLGALIVDYKGNRLGVGSGFTDTERAIIWKNSAAYIGKQVEIETFGESVNAAGIKSLNCPIFKRFVGQEE